MEKYDAIVVGAGTAGCLAAKTIAEKGLKVCHSRKEAKNRNRRKNLRRRPRRAPPQHSWDLKNLPAAN